MGLREGELEEQQQQQQAGEAGDIEQGRKTTQRVLFEDDVKKEEGSVIDTTQDTAKSHPPSPRKRTWKPAHYNVSMHGMISHGDVRGQSMLYCRYSYFFGPDWVLKKGAQAYGVTQMAEKRSTIGGGHVEGVSWNLPLEANFVSTNAHGWPQICLTVFSQDWLGRDIVLGYGSTHIPLHSGHFRRRVHLYAPQTSSFLQAAANYVFGVRPEFVNPSFPCFGAGRELTRVRSGGTVEVAFDVVINKSDSLDHGEFEMSDCPKKSNSWWSKGITYFKK